MIRDEQHEYYEEEWRHIELASKAGRTGWRTTVPAPDFIEFVSWLNSQSVKGKALDLGCGGGRHAIYLAQHGFEVSGIDFAAAAIDKAKASAKEKGVEDRCHFIVGDVLNLPYPDEEFDLVNDDGCFHHIEPHDWERYLKGVARVLKKPGIFRLKVFSMSSSYRDGYASTKQEQWVKLTNSNYTYFFREQELKQLLSKHFDVESLYEKTSSEADDKRFFFVVCKPL